MRACLTIIIFFISCNNPKGTSSIKLITQNPKKLIIIDSINYIKKYFSDQNWAYPINIKVDSIFDKKLILNY